ncbi:TPA: ketopantoate reductase family protein [Candidatus Gastranaerophilales bacterium HUM_20]|nr:2-dehydropantoate 2-reductase [Clostridium sp. CAG:729]DAB22686.1 MAG TPA: ketopantoate reductase family protein [Candidatus Gastranaerophilales bacterium HUM_20]
MKDIKNVLICGVGAVGSIYADKIQNFDSDSLRVLVDEQRLKRYLDNPIVFNGKELNFNYVLPDENNYKADLIIIATKFYGLEDAINNIKNFITDDTVILSLLNGVTSEEIIAKAYGRDKLLYSYFIGHSAIRTGNSVIHDDVNTIVYGSENEADNENVLRVKKYFDKAGINYKIPEDIKHSLWLKFMLNVCANQPTAILRMTFGEMLENSCFMDFAIEVMKEVQAIAKAEGVKNSEAMIDETVAHLHTMIPEGKTSMLQDVEAGRKTEVDMFAGTVIQLGIKHNIPTPYNKVLKEMVEIIHKSQDLKQSSKVLTAIGK